jgi:hypothetical protein
MLLPLKSLVSVEVRHATQLCLNPRVSRREIIYLEMPGAQLLLQGRREHPAKVHLHRTPAGASQ